MGRDFVGLFVCFLFALLFLEGVIYFVLDFFLGGGGGSMKQLDSFGPLDVHV